MKKISILFVAVLGLASCKNETKENKATEAQEMMTTEAKTTALELGCYSYSGNNSMINLEITDLENGVEGTLEPEFGISI